MNARGAPRDRLGRLRDEDLVSQAADAGGLDEDGRERLQKLAEGLLSVPAAEASALLLRELDGLTYEEIAGLAGVTSAGARRAVYRARIALQGNVVPPTEHCDEVRVAMSKAETSVRDRRSITSHLERCEVCSDFADGLERRPDELRLLFGEPDAEDRAAALVAAGAAGAGAGAGAGAAEAAATTEMPAGVGSNGAGGNGASAAPPARRRRREPSEARRQRRRRRLIAPLVVLLLLAAAGAALAIVLASGGGKSHKTTAATPPPTANPTRSHRTPPPAQHKPKHPVKKAPARKPKKAHHGAAKKHAKASGAKKSGSKRRHGETAVAAATGAAKGSSARAAKGSSGSGTRPSGTATSRGAAPAAAAPTTSNASGETRGASSLTERESSAQAGYSSRAGSVQQEVHGGGLPSTGLQIAIVVAAAAVLLALGVTLRRLTRSRA